MKKKVVKEKKKGPKGKKARAKAKLERQWGEETVLDKQDKPRRGKSRLLSSSPKKKKRDNDSRQERMISEPTYEFPNDVSEDDSSDDDEKESDTEAAAPMTNLLQSIRNKISVPKQKASRVVQDQDDDSDDNMDENQDDEQQANDDDIMQEDDDSDVDLESESELETEENDVNENEKDDDDYLEHTDLFRQRFSREPLLAGAEALTSNDQPVIKLTLDANLELHVTAAAESDLESRLLQIKADNKDGSTEKDALQSISRESFECNRQVLQRQWKRKQKGLSTSQSQLYPFLSRYMDLLVTTDSIKVRKLRLCLNILLFVLLTCRSYTHLIILPHCSSTGTRCTTCTCCIF
jgi:hypothetical protein